MTFRKIKDIVLVVILACCLVSVVSTKLADELGIVFPEWMGIGKHNSQLEGRNYTARPKVDVGAITQGKFQTNAETYLSDVVPMRDNILLANAALQRACIKTANVPLGFECYPTFFGSSYVFIPQYDIVCEGQANKSEKLTQDLLEAADAWNNLIGKHNDVRWLVYMPDRALSNMVLPNHYYRSDPADYDYYERNFLDNIDPGVIVVSGKYNDAGSFVEDHFRTDHHWQISGAKNAYISIAQTLALTPTNLSSEYFVDTSSFFGSGARNGLCVTSEPDLIRDVYYDLSDIIVKIDGEEVDTTELDLAASDADVVYEKKDTFENMYASWFHTDYGLVELENLQVDQGSLLIVGDSYTNNMERFFTANYRKIYVLDPRHSTLTVDEFIDSTEIDDAIVCMTASGIASEAVIDKLFIDK